MDSYIFLIYLVGVVLFAILIGVLSYMAAVAWPFLLFGACIIGFFKGLWHLGAWIVKTVDHV